MRLSLSFRFVDDGLNDKFIRLVKFARIDHSVDGDGRVHFAPADETVVEGDLIRSIRDQVFSSWQVLTCPHDWTERYREYMSRHDIPFQEELIDDELWFLIPRKYRPHLWKLTEKKTQQKVRLAR